MLLLSKKKKLQDQIHLLNYNTGIKISINKPEINNYNDTIFSITTSLV